MTNPVRFYFDQHMPNAAADALRRHGADVRTAHEAGTCGNPDDGQLRYATADGRAVVTHDRDYLTHAADFLSRGEPFAGVVYCDPDRYQYDLRRLIRDLLILFGVLTADDMLDHVEYLT
ncbi:MAG: DUF5615 family PIN-like protein [Gemmataceae bacterium]|nr:DUF5615 family PIN-like protein [Gemmataceae bacterium]